MSTTIATTPVVDTTTAAAENAAAEKKGTKVIKAVGFTNWRSSLTEEDAVSFANETIPQLDDCLLNLNWATLADIEFSADVTAAFPVNVTFIHKHAREQFNITSPAIRLRIANNLAWLASRVMWQAAAFVKSQGRNRIMQSHIVASWTLVSALLSEVKWAAGAPAKTTVAEPTAAAAAAAADVVVVVEPPVAAAAAPPTATKRGRTPAAAAATAATKKAKTVSVS